MAKSNALPLYIISKLKVGLITMEVWDLYDRNRNLIGKDLVRGEDIPDGCYHLCVHVWIRNIAGQYLISQRSADRPTYPLKWECVGGSVVKGESSLQGALRETLEEVGVSLDKQKGKLVFSKIRDKIDGKKYNDILDVWLFEYNGEANLQKATTKEVAQTKWVTKDQIATLYNQGDFVGTLDYFFHSKLSF